MHRIYMPAQTPEPLPFIEASVNYIYPLCKLHLTLGLAPAHFCIQLVYQYIWFGGISGRGEHQWAVSEPS